jgi:hypothetical protein
MLHMKAEALGENCVTIIKKHKITPTLWSPKLWHSVILSVHTNILTEDYTYYQSVGIQQ